MSNIVDVMLATGARLGEVLALRWADMALGADCPNLTHQRDDQDRAEQRHLYARPARSLTRA